MIQYQCSAGKRMWSGWKPQSGFAWSPAQSWEHNRAQDRALPQPVLPINNLSAKKSTWKGNLNEINWFIQTIIDASRQSPATGFMGAASATASYRILCPHLQKPLLDFLRGSQSWKCLESSTLTTKCCYNDLHTAPGTS